MGYYSKFSLDVIDINNTGCDPNEIASYMLDMSEKFDKFYPFEDELRSFLDENNPDFEKHYKLCLPDCGESTWSEHEKDMKELSNVFKDILFRLHGEGERVADKWNKYFMNGKMQYCQGEVMYPPFTKEKLK